MKNLIIALSMVFVGNIASADFGASIARVDQTEVSVGVKLSLGQFSSMCYETVTSFKIQNAGEFEEKGLIEITTQLEPNTICLMAFGPHSSFFELQKGKSLPAVQSGSVYKLVVNGEFAGEIAVD
ncbi:MAG: hypothetical protein KDD25_07925 [Bdellovibrionales bacterium]|nr:hypothetical protein [Bdellovibrionales bacterium]